jgi:hypothetical protein
MIFLSAASDRQQLGLRGRRRLASYARKVGALRPMSIRRLRQMKEEPAR